MLRICYTEHFLSIVSMSMHACVCPLTLPDDSSSKTIEGICP